MTQLTCRSCANEEPEGAHFCGHCGAPLAIAGQPTDQIASDLEEMLTCPRCGNEEPEGARFCGNCGTALTPTAAVVRDGSPSQLTLEPSSAREPSPVTSAGRSRLPWLAAGAVVLLLVAGGIVAVLLMRPEGAASNEATRTASSAQPETTSEDVTRSTSPTLAEILAPSFKAVTTSQDTLDDRLRSLEAGAKSFAALHDAAASLAASVAQAQQVVDDLAPSQSTNEETLELVRGVLAAHLAYAEALSSFPPSPRSLTDLQARAATARAEEAQLAYARLAFADPDLPSVFVSTAGNTRLLAVVPAVKPRSSPPVRRAIDLVPLLVGIRPDDPPSEGRCFGAYTTRASLRVSGVVHRSGFIQCGDDATGDPSRTSGVYRFSRRTLPSGSRPARVTAQVAIDESSSPSQRGSRVTWTVFYKRTNLLEAGCVERLASVAAEDRLSAPVSRHREEVRPATASHPPGCLSCLFREHVGRPARPDDRGRGSGVTLIEWRQRRRGAGAGTARR